MKVYFKQLIFVTESPYQFKNQYQFSIQAIKIRAHAFIEHFLIKDCTVNQNNDMSYCLDNYQEGQDEDSMFTKNYFEYVRIFSQCRYTKSQ